MAVKKGILRVHDGKPITERSGVESGQGEFTAPPTEGVTFLFYWDKGVAKHPTDPSPGIATDPYNIKREGNSYMFEDAEGRLFDLLVLE